MIHAKSKMQEVYLGQARAALGDAMEDGKPDLYDIEGVQIGFLLFALIERVVALEARLAEVEGQS